MRSSSSQNVVVFGRVRLDDPLSASRRFCPFQGEREDTKIPPNFLWSLLSCFGLSGKA